MSQVENQEKNRGRLEKFRQEMSPEFFEKFKKKTQKRLMEIDAGIVAYKRACNLARAKNRTLVIRGKAR